MAEETQFAIYRVQSKNADDSTFLDVPFLLFEGEESSGACRRSLSALGMKGAKLKSREAPSSPPSCQSPDKLLPAAASLYLHFEFEFASATPVTGQLYHHSEWDLIDTIDFMRELMWLRLFLLASSCRGTTVRRG